MPQHEVEEIKFAKWGFRVAMKKQAEKRGNARRVGQRTLECVGLNRVTLQTETD